MPKKFLMTWKPGDRRWRKMHRGVVYTVSCRQLRVAETKEASWRAANAWWQAKLAEVLAGPEDPALVRSRKAEALLREFRKLGDADRRLLVDELLGTGSYDRARADAARV